MSTHRYSNVYHDRVEYSFWLTFDERGGVTLTRGEPSLNAGERAMRCSTTLPRSLFRLTALQANIEVAEGAPQAVNLDIKAAGEDAVFDLAQELAALRVKYKMRTGEDA